MRFLTRKRLVLILVVVAVYAFYSFAFAASGPEAAGEEGSGESGPVLQILLALIVVLLAAKLGGDVFERFRQPAVLGELVMGMIIGNIHLLGLDIFEPFKHDITLDILAEIGVIILLFEVGLENTVKQMMQVGLSSFMVAVFGVIAPFFLGWGVGVVFLPEEGMLVHIFLGATLTATSVGITARVLKDLGKIDTREARIILGAAVIDDILGLVILAIVTGVISAANTGSEGGISSGQILWIIAKAVLFIAGAIVVGSVILPSVFRMAFRLKGRGVFLSFVLLVCFTLAYIAGEVGLAPIVGAFAAGLILEEVHFKSFRDAGEHHVGELIEPISTFLVPIFFVYMGMKVDLTTFARVEILGFAAILTLAAILGKQVCGLAIFERQVHRLTIGLGMIPRGEVGLIFAGIGAKMMLNGEPVVSSATYSAVVIMVMATTLVTPPALKVSLRRVGGHRTGPPAE